MILGLMCKALCFGACLSGLRGAIFTGESLSLGGLCAVNSSAQ